MQSPQLYRARLEDKSVLNSKYTHYSFELIEPNGLTFVAGQYVSMKVSARGDRRSYSIISPPSIDHGFELLVDLSPAGVGSQYLESLQFGQEVELMAPLGRLAVPENFPQNHLVFVATGAGIAPFKSMILDQLQDKRTTKQITLHWGMRFAEDLFWLDELGELQESFPNFRLHLVLSKAQTDWTLCRGRVTDCLSVHERPANALYFLCGNDGMIRDVTALLTQQGITPDQIITEKFF